MSRSAHVWVGASVVALAWSLASCTASDAAMSGDAGAAGAADKGEGGAAADFAPAFYTDAGAAGALPVCTTTEPSQCRIGEALVTSEGRYCPYCRACAMDEKNVCPPYACGPSAHDEMAAGQCCSTCVPNDPALCATQQAAYAEQREPITIQYVSACNKDEDCASALVNTPCEQTCVAASTELAPAFAADLSALSCPACALQPPISIRPQGHCATASCLKGLCIVGTVDSK